MRSSRITISSLSNVRNDLMYKNTPIKRGANTQQIADARFVDTATGDYALQRNSPGVDAGNSTLVGQYATLATDLAGNPRPFANTTIDVGAFETQGNAVASLSIQKHSPPWVSAGVPFEFALTVTNQGKLPASDLVVTDEIPTGALYVEGSASDGGTFNNRTLTWNIGTLQAGQTKRVTYRVTATQTLSSTGYRVQSTSNPLVEDSGPVVQTPLNTNIVASLGFFPVPDGFGFPNWGAPSEETDLTAEDMVALFGANVCVKGTNPCVLTVGAQAWREQQLKSAEGGHCFGMSVASVRSFQDLPFKGKTQPGEFQSNATTVFDLVRDQTIQNYITFYHVTQSTSRLGRLANSSQNANPLNRQGDGWGVSNGLPTDFLDKLIANLQDPNAADRYVAGFWKRHGGVGHAVTPYAVENKGGEIFWVHVYDNNYPEDFSRVIKINRSVNTWIYEGASINPNAPASDWEGDANTRSLMLLSTLDSGTTPKVCKFCVTTARDSHESTTEISLNGEGHVLVTDNQGRRVGYDPATGAFVNEIDGAEQQPMLLGLDMVVPPTINLPGGLSYNVDVFNSENGINPFQSTGDLLLSAPGFAATLSDLKLDSPPIEPEDDVNLSASSEKQSQPHV